MSHLYKHLGELVGRTPLLEAERFTRALELPCRLLLKLEYFNPAGSVKDRIAAAMIAAAEAAGRLRPGVKIIEPTSGNTGIGLAALAAAKGYACCLVMPESMSVERRRIMQIYGAELVLTPAAEGMGGAIAKAAALAAALGDRAFVPAQFENPANPAAHEATTGPEIWADSAGAVDVLVAGVGTGGTLSGAGRFLKAKKPELRVFAVEPEASPVLSGGEKGPHRIQGIGAGFVPRNYDAAVCDGVVRVADEEALKMSRLLARTEGLLVGISSGAALAAAAALARRADCAGRCLVCVLPDTGERYLSTELFADPEQGTEA